MLDMENHRLFLHISSHLLHSISSSFLQAIQKQKAGKFQPQIHNALILPKQLKITIYSYPGAQEGKASQLMTTIKDNLISLIISLE